MTLLSTELAVWTALFVLNIVSIWIGYRWGASAWMQKFSYVRIDKDGHERSISGQWGEFVITILWFGGIVLITIFCGAALMERFPFWGWISTLAMLIVATVSVFIYAQGVVKDEKASGRMDDQMLVELKRGYVFYRFFAIMLWIGAFVAILKILIQFGVDARVFFDASKDLLATQSDFANSLGPRIDLSEITVIERSFISYTEINRSVIRQLEPLMILVSYMLVVVILVAQTPIKDSFHGDAKQIGFYVAIGALIGTLAVAAGVYYFQYAQFSADYLATTQTYVNKEFTDFSYLERVSEILDHILDFSGFSGFLRIFAEEGGIYIVALALAQIASSAISKKDEDDT